MGHNQDKLSLFLPFQTNSIVGLLGSLNSGETRHGGALRNEWCGVVLTNHSMSRFPNRAMVAREYTGGLVKGRHRVHYYYIPAWTYPSTLMLVSKTDTTTSRSKETSLTTVLMAELNSSTYPNT